MSIPCIGSRVEDLEGFKATIRYTGPVAAAKNQKDTWLGVEWDDESRGKHDGSCVDSSGVFHRYFECKMGSGSFVKPSKVSKFKTIIEALHDRYVEVDAPEISQNDKLPDAFVTTLKGNLVNIEFLGEHKLRKWQQVKAITKVAMRNAGVASIGDGSELNELAGHVIEVDLQDNLLWEWNQVSELCAALPMMQSLLLHGNRFQRLSSGVSEKLNSLSLSGLRVLALNNCNLQCWSDVLLLCGHIPQIEELYLAKNKLADVPMYTGTVVSSSTTTIGTPLCNQLRIVDISFCQLTDWRQVLAIGVVFPNTEELLVDGNELVSICSPLSILSESPAQLTFSKMHRLSASSNSFDDWCTSVDMLKHYSALKHLRLSSIPLFSGKGASEVRPVVIARLSSLTFFNGSGVSPKERVDAEKVYLRRCMRELQESSLYFPLPVRGEEEHKGAEPVAPEGQVLLASTLRPAYNRHTFNHSASLPVPPVTESSSGSVDAVPMPVTGPTSFCTVATEVLSLHPRFQELFSQYGADILSLGQSSGGAANHQGTLMSDLISLTFRNMTTGGDFEPVVKKLPSSLSVAKLKLMIKQLFGLDVHLQLLSLKVYKNTPPFPLDDDMSSIGYFGAVDGAEVFVSEAKRAD